MTTVAIPGMGDVEVRPIPPKLQRAIRDRVLKGRRVDFQRLMVLKLVYGLKNPNFTEAEATQVTQRFSLRTLGPIVDRIDALSGTDEHLRHGQDEAPYSVRKLTQPMIIASAWVQRFPSPRGRAPRPATNGRMRGSKRSSCTVSSAEDEPPPPTGRVCARPGCDQPLPPDSAPQRRFCESKGCKDELERERKRKARALHFHDSPIMSGPRRKVAAGPATETLARQLGKEPQGDLLYRLDGKDDDPLRLLEAGKRAKAEKVAQKEKATFLATLLLAPGGQEKSIDSPDRMARLIDGGRKPAPAPRASRATKSDWDEVHTSLALAPGMTKLVLEDSSRFLFITVRKIPETKASDWDEAASRLWLAEQEFVRAIGHQPSREDLEWLEATA